MGLAIGYMSFGAAALAYLGLALFYLLYGRWGGHGPYLLAAALLTAVWALLSLLGHGVIPRHPGWTMLLQQTAMLAWVWLLWHIITSLEQFRQAFPRRLRLCAVMVVGTTAAILLQGGLLLLGDAAGPAPGGGGPISLGLSLLPLGLGLTIAVLGLSLTETLYRGYQPVERWGIKFLCLATGALFTYDVFLYGEGLLFRVLDPTFLEVRGLAQALVVPFLVINIRRSEVRHFALGLSQHLIFGSTLMLGAGAYLAIMAGVAFYVRTVGGVWAVAIQIIFLFGAILLLAAFLLSGAFRARLRTFFSHHVLRDKYDYRAEWLRFSERLASADSAESFERRVIRALADIVDSPAGALWGVGENHLPIAAAWNLSPASLTALDMTAVEDFLKAQNQVQDLTEDDGTVAGAPAAYGQLRAALRAIPEAWVLIPLLHRDRLVALLLLTRPRSRRDLAPEDGELLGTAARQAAGLLAERGLARDLAEARQFERFNQRYAFVAHDLKNLVSQLSLVVRNHERFGDRPAFQEDMIETIQSAVTRMESVMTRLSGPSGAPKEDRKEDAGDGAEDKASDAAVAPLLRQLVAQHQGRVAALDLSLTADAEVSRLKADSARIETMLRHLLQNAIEAAGAEGLVTITLRCQGNQIVIEVRDNGPGMEAHFIEEELFKPFRSTKSGGFGIGAYQCRVLARELGGELEAVSAPGAGTTMRLSLPREG